MGWLSSPGLKSSRGAWSLFSFTYREGAAPSAIWSHTLLTKINKLTSKQKNRQLKKYGTESKFYKTFSSFHLKFLVLLYFTNTNLGESLWNRASARQSGSWNKPSQGTWVWPLVTVYYSLLIWCELRTTTPLRYLHAHFTNTWFPRQHVKRKITIPSINSLHSEYTVLQ